MNYSVTWHRKGSPVIHVSQVDMGPYALGETGARELLAGILRIPVAEIVVDKVELLN